MMNLSKSRRYAQVVFNITLIFSGNEISSLFVIT